LKQVNSTAARLYNWNIIIKALDFLGLEIDSDTKALIVAGDTSIIFNLISDI